MNEFRFTTACATDVHVREERRVNFATVEEAHEYGLKMLRFAKPHSYVKVCIVHRYLGRVWYEQVDYLTERTIQ